MGKSEDFRQLEQEKAYSSQVNRALGIFLFSFGLIILFSIFLTETFRGQMTNLVAGLIITGMGAGFLCKGRSSVGPRRD